MRTTVTLDEDVEQMIRAVMNRTRRSFKETVNAALRVGLTASPVRGGRRKRFVVKATAMGLRAGIDPAGLNRLADDLEVEAVLGAAERGRDTA